MNQIYMLFIFPNKSPQYNYMYCSKPERLELVFQSNKYNNDSKNEFLNIKI